MTSVCRNAARRIAALLLASSFLLSSGCVTSTFRMTEPEPGQLSSEGHTIRKVLHGMNTGVYLFYWIPLWSGSPRRPNRREYDLFEHQVDWKAMRRMFDKANRKLKGDGIEDFTCRESSSGVFGLWIFWKRAVRADAVCVTYRKKSEKSASGKKKTVSGDKKAPQTAPGAEKSLKNSSGGDKL